MPNPPTDKRRARRVGTRPVPRKDTDTGPSLAAAGERFLGELAELLLGRTPAPRADAGSGQVFVGLAELSNHDRPTRHLSTTDDKAVVLQTGDVVVARLSNIGASTLVEENHLANGVLGRECVAIRPTDPGITGTWLYLWSLSDHFQEQVRRSTSGGVMPRLDVQALRKFLVPVPDLSTQAALRETDGRFETAIEDLQHLLRDVIELRQLELNIAIADLAESARLHKTDGGEAE